MIDARMNMIRIRGGYIGHLSSTSGILPTDTFLMCSLAGVTTGFDIVRQHNGVPHSRQPLAIDLAAFSKVLSLLDAGASLFYGVL